MSGRRSALFAALAGLTVALPARAQWGSGGMRRGPSGPLGGDNLRRRPPDDGSTEAVGFGVGFLVDAVGQRLGECQQRLALQTQQLGAWNAFGGAVQGVVTDLLRQSAADTGAGTALQRIARRVDVARNRLAGLESVEEAARALYEMLDDGQRLVADAALPELVALLGDQARPNGRGTRGR